MQPGYGPPPAGERWNVNMPAVIGVVFVFLVGVVVWVIATSGGDGEAGQARPTDPPTAASTSSTDPISTPAPTLSPTPLPTSTNLPTTTTTPATTTSTTITTTTTIPATTTTPAPATTAPDANGDAVPGDLGVPGRAMERPTCDGAYITVLASPIGDQATSAAVGAVLDLYPGSNYLRTDQTCPSLNPDADGEPIYVVYLGPFAVASDACSARSEGPEGAYARELSDELGPDHAVTCV